LLVPARVFDVEGGAVWSKNSPFGYFDGTAWTIRLRFPSPIMAPGKIHREKSEGYSLTKEAGVRVAW